VRVHIVPMSCHAVLAPFCRRIERRGYVLLVRRPVERCTKAAFPGTIRPATGCATGLA